MKKSFVKIIAIISIVLVCFGFTVTAEQHNPISVVIDSENVIFNDDLGYPFVDGNNRTLVPFRVTLEKFGATVSWDSENKLAIAEKNSTIVKVPMEHKYIIKNDVQIQTDSPAQAIDGRIYLPIRAVLEAFDCQVDWNSKTQSVEVNSPAGDGDIAKFADINLEKAIRIKLRKPSGNILVNELKNITELEARNCNIQSLEGIQQLENLEELDIFNNFVQDLTPLQSLKNLYFIDMQQNYISDLYGLPTSLKQFSGFGNPVNDTFSTESKISKIINAFYFEGKADLAQDMAQNLSKLIGKKVDLKIVNWSIKETDNFRFYFQPNTKVSNISKFMSDREEAFMKINKVFNASLYKKIDFFVWNSNDDSQKEIKKTLGFALPEACVIHSNYNQTIGHEMTHVIIGNLTGYRHSEGLIEEGLATYFNLENENKMLIAKQSVNKAKKKIDIKELWLYWPGENLDNPYLYSTAAAFVGYLIEEEGIEKMLELAKKQSYVKAKVIYGDRINQLIAGFEKQLHTEN